MKRVYKYFGFPAFFAFMCFSTLSYSQDNQAKSDEVKTEETKENADSDNMPKFDPIKDVYDLSSIPSLFFTLKQHQAIQNAKADRKRNGAVRPLSQKELDDLENGELYESEREFVREVSLGGIVYNGKEDWTVWLNEQRVTPEAIPSQVLSLKVSKDFIELRWFDEKTDNVFPIRLRAHQRFNLDARIFLTGE